MNKLELTKINNKSQIYENEQYHVMISDINGVFYVINGKGGSNVPYDYDKNDGELTKFDDTVEVKLTNKRTGKSTQKRCYQGYEVIREIQDALDGKTSKFEKLFNKIDR